jgi:hypothetical protein
VTKFEGEKMYLNRKMPINGPVGPIEGRKQPPMQHE